MFLLLEIMVEVILTTRFSGKFLTPGGSKEPVGNVKAGIEAYGGFEKFKEDFSTAAENEIRFLVGLGYAKKKMVA